MFDHPGKINVQNIDLSDTAPGIYLITLTVRESDRTTENQFVVKIQII